MIAVAVVVLVLLLALLAGGFLFGIRRVPPGKVGIVTRKIGRTDPRFQRIAPGDTVGVQARALLPNTMTWLMPLLYRVEFVDAVRVPKGMIGLVFAVEGKSPPRDRSIGRQVECNDFQDGKAFLEGGGEQGAQVATLRTEQTYYLNTQLFRVRMVPRVFVPGGTIGLVNAMVGPVRAPDQRFGRHVECDSFQDGQRFLDAGGEQGRQLAILAGGTFYDINPRLFDVITVVNVGHYRAEGLTFHHLRDISVPIGNTGVVITLDGIEPDQAQGKTVGPVVPGHRNFRLPWIFLYGNGYRGVQQQTLGEGTIAALNPWFVRVVVIPTRVLIMEWSNKTDSQVRNYDAELDRIAVTIQGHRIHIDMSQTLRIPDSAAPRLVSEFGGTDNSALGGLSQDPLPVQRFVEKVLGATVEAYFSEIAAGSTIEEFFSRYSEIRTELASQVRNALLAWGVEASNTNLGSFEAEDPKLNAELQNVVSEQLRGRTLEVARDNVVVSDAIDEIQVRVERRRAALELEAEIAALGPKNVAMIRLVREMTKMNVPQYIGGADVSAIAEMLPMPMLQNLIRQLHDLQTTSEVEPAATVPPTLDQETEITE